MSPKPPCIRGLKEFKRGCPQEKWNSFTGRGCPAWITRTVPTRSNPSEGETISQCLDLWLLTVNWDANKLLEGTNQAIESFRNNMTETTEFGDYPKASRGLRYLINFIEEEMKTRQIIYAHETRKKLVNDS